jgi:hypothetical protein
MLTTWQVPLEEEEEQLPQVTLFSIPCDWLSFIHPYCDPLHGSALKFQSVFPNASAISRKASTAKVMIDQL